MRTIVYTINKYLFAGILILILCTNLLAQEIDVTLSGNTSSEGFSIKKLSGTTLFRFRGDGRFGIGTTNPGATLHVAANDFLVGPDPGDDLSLEISGVDVKLGDIWGNQFGNYLFIDAEGVGNFQFIGGNVGIGTTSPSAKLDVVGTTELNGTVDISGEVNRTAMDVSFYAYNSSTDVVAGSSTFKAEFDSERHDDGSNYNKTLDRFIAPVSGVYHFDTSLNLAGLTVGGLIDVYLFKNGSIIVILSKGRANASIQSFGGSAVIKLNAGDYIDVRSFIQAASPSLNGNSSGYKTYFSGHRLY